MIELVAAFLRAAGVEPTWEDVADTLWLAQEIGRHQPPADLKGTTPKAVPGNPPPPQTGLTRPDGPEIPKAGGEHGYTNTPSAAATLHLPPAPGTPMPPGGLPFHAPAATALPGALALGHALRPLKRRLPSATTRVLDEEATAERIAEERILTPVLRPALTRWLDLALVIDQSPSMAIWARTVEELRGLLESLGAFRDVRIWLLDTDTADGQAVLYAGTESATSHARPSAPRALVDPGGGRLILVVSDCVAPAWSSGAVPALLSLWCRTSPVAIVHVLPQRLWRYTAIETEPAELRAPNPGAPNAKLNIASWVANAERELEVALAAAASASPLALRDDTAASFGVDASAVPVPVIALEPRWLAPWASLVAGAGGRQVPGVITWAKPWAGESPDTPEAAGLERPPTNLSPAERVRRFRGIVSPTAFELAGYLAAVPLTLPIMRVVQQAMLPGSAQVHLAEVLLGGLLERPTPLGPTVHPDNVEYDFVDGVRDVLLDTVRGTDTLRVLHTVGEFVGRHAGRTQTFPSLLLASDEAAAGSREERAFAAVTARTLRRFGASYEELADRLEQIAITSVPTDITQRFYAGEALPDTEEAVALYRELAAASPDRYRPGLAESLNNLGFWYSELGRLAEALAVEQEAVALYRELAAASPDRYRPGLAASLANLGSRLAELGRLAEALAVEQEAVALYRELAAASPDRYRPGLAESLNNLGFWYSELGRLAEALAVEQEAVALYRELAAASPDRYRPDLAASLANLGSRLAELGRLAEALAVEQEAVALYRELAAASPDRYRPDLAESLNNLGFWFSELGRPAEALAVEQEAVALYRELAAASPDRYRPDLAASLANLGSRLAELGRPAEALAVEQEAVALYRELAAASPDRYRPDLAASLANLGIRFSELGRPAEALPVEQEAVALYRELAAASPDRYRPDLAASLANLGSRFAELGRPAEALAVEQEAVALYRELAAASPDRYRPDLAESLNNLGFWYSELGRPAEALAVEQEAVALYRELAAASPDRYRPGLAASLANLGSRLSELGRPAEALAVEQEAVALYRELAAASPDRYGPGLAQSLNNLGFLRERLGSLRGYFVDRYEELSLFRRLLSGHDAWHMLLIEGGQGMGKSALLEQFYSDSAAYPRALVDLRPQDYTPIEVLGELASGLENTIANLGHAAEGGVSVFPQYAEQRKRLAQARKRLAQAETYTDKLETAGLFDARAEQAALQIITDAFFSDLDALLKEYPRIVLMIDTFEKANIEVVQWASGLFLNRIRGRHGIAVVLAGRTMPDLGPASAAWQLKPLDLPNVREYLNRTEVSLSDEEINVLYALTTGIPLDLRMAVARLLLAKGRDGDKRSRE